MSARFPALRSMPFLAMFLLCAQFTHAKSAAEYFRGGAYHYVAGKHQQALIEVEEGLQKYPEDKTLQKLAEQIRKMKDSQNPQNGKGDDKNKKDDQKKDDKNKGDKKDDKKDPEKDKDKDKDKDPDKKDGENKPDPSKDDDKNPDKGKNPAGAPPPGEMSKEDAQRLLNSFADDEKKEQRERQKLLRKRLESDQDW